MDLLQQFYENANMREQVQAYLITGLKEDAVTVLLKGEDASHLAQAIRSIESSFDKLKQAYEPPKKSSIKNVR